MTDSGDDNGRTFDEKASRIARARQLKVQARDGGQRIDAFELGGA